MKLFKGKKYKFIHTQDIELDDIRAVFFPKDFSEKYKYLGSIPYKEDSDVFRAVLPLVLVMDFYAKPKWCPRWFLRFLHLFGNDNSIVRVRNIKLHELHRKLTKGILLVDYKTKWHWYDLRLSVHAPWYIQNLADDIENRFYNRGRRSELLQYLEDTPKAKGRFQKWDPLHELEELYRELQTD